MSHNKKSKKDPELIEALKKYVTIDKDTGEIKCTDIYMSVYVNISWKGGIVSIPYSHLAFLLTYGRWPENSLVIDHINDDPLDNRPSNLQEITPEENNKKRRNRKTYRNYGTGKYGYGFGIYRDKRDGKYYVSRCLPRAETKTDKTVKLSYGNYTSIQDAEYAIKSMIEIITGSKDPLDTLF